MKLIHRILCKLGWHGPELFGPNSRERSKYIGPRLRQCCHCKATWICGKDDVSWEKI